MVMMMTYIYIYLLAWIPTWAFGRRFQENKNMERLPEQSLDIMNG